MTPSMLLQTTAIRYQQAVKACSNHPQGSQAFEDCIKLKILTTQLVAVATHLVWQAVRVTANRVAKGGGLRFAVILFADRYN